jgi:iron complex transport system ATP-binding protein
MSELHAHGLDVTIGERVLCRGLELTVRGGERWCVLGRNGAGKTTLLQTLAGLRRPAAGTVAIDGQPLNTLSARHRAQRIGMLFQDHHDSFPATVLETALIGRHPWLGPLQWEGARDRQRALDALTAFDLALLAQRDVTTLSGGERRRLGLATLLTQDTPLMLLDEPVNHLDVHQQVRVLEQVRRLAGAGKGLVMVLHDLNIAARYCDNFLLLFDDGTHVQGLPEVALSADNLTRLYHHPLARHDTPAGPVWLPV